MNEVEKPNEDDVEVCKDERENLTSLNVEETEKKEEELNKCCCCLKHNYVVRN